MFNSQCACIDEDPAEKQLWLVLFSVPASFFHDETYCAFIIAKYHTDPSEF